MICCQFGWRVVPSPSTTREETQKGWRCLFLFFFLVLEVSKFSLSLCARVLLGVLLPSGRSSFEKSDGMIILLTLSPLSLLRPFPGSMLEVLDVWSCLLLVRWGGLARKGFMNGWTWMLDDMAWHGAWPESRPDDRDDIKHQTKWQSDEHTQKHIT
ncbi:hypothetical protein B0T24DRAFT_130006 [Lasiosphaeria ovina]|uniref:Uncharacterized protein n=1 Tax=Lasiosphaeria ovina TaxID=92902 RepID=A0AAE0MXD7_9PEZI|nr:hypothetical protein B0T24DRAFT_130006 [Lasiosphaeria ovina]